MQEARHRIKRYKSRKTIEISLLGEICKSGTLDSVGRLREIADGVKRHGYGPGPESGEQFQD